MALHINHGLQAAASEFEEHCRTLCRALEVPLRVSAVHAAHAPGQSPEDAARIARYRGLLALANQTQPPLPAIALAQHADDQVETVFLALSRGAGLAGLSAMPAHWVRDGVDFFRPLLQVPGAAIRDWLQNQSQPFVTDPTNGDERFTRNRIRARLLPVFEQVFPHFRDTIARSAAHAAQAQGLLDELALQDLQKCVRPEDGWLLLKPVQQLSAPRQINVLRYWLKAHYQVIPSSAQLDELLRQVACARTRGQQIRIKVGQGFAVRKGPALAWYNPQDLLPKN